MSEIGKVLPSHFRFYYPYSYSFSFQFWRNLTSSSRHLYCGLSRYRIIVRALLSYFGPQFVNAADMFWYKKKKMCSGPRQPYLYLTPVVSVPNTWNSFLYPYLYSQYLLKQKSKTFNLSRYERESDWKTFLFNFKTKKSR